MGVFNVTSVPHDYPGVTIWGQTTGPVVDLMNDHPGGRVYLSETETAEVFVAVVPEVEKFPKVAAVLEANGWVSPAADAERDADYGEMLAAQVARAELAESERDALKIALGIVKPDAPEPEPEAAVVPIAEKRKPGRPKKDAA